MPKMRTKRGAAKRLKWESGAHRVQRAAWVLVPCQLGWKRWCGGDDVDLWQQLADPGTHLLDVNDRGDADRPRVAGRLGRGGRFVTINDEQSSRLDGGS